MPYQPMLDSSYCMDVPASPFYNRIVDEKKVGSAAVKGSTEPMRLDLHNKGDVRYREGFVIAHNPDNQPGKGSCIFAHLWRRPARPPPAAPPCRRNACRRCWTGCGRRMRRASCCCRAPSTRACRPSGSCPHWRRRPLSAQDEPQLQRAVSRWQIVGLSINDVIGSGIYLLPAATVALLGPFSLWGVAAGIVVALLVLCYAQAASYFDEPGGSYLYAREAFGRFAGFEIGWMIWLTRISSAAALSNALADAVAPGRGPAPAWAASR
jgi:hypothetical protein